MQAQEQRLRAHEVVAAVRRAIRARRHLLAASVIGASACGGADADANPAGLYERVLTGDATPVEQESFNEIYHDRVQAAIVDCMDEAGFEFRPVPLQSADRAEYLADPASLDFVEARGFGMVESVLRPPSDAELADPNSEYYQSLSDSARTAYDANLDGDDDREGCREQSVAAVRDDLALEEVRADHEATDAAVTSSGTYQSALGLWRRCADRAGYRDFDDPAALAASFLDRALASDQSRTTLAELREEEIVAATSTYACSAELRSTYRRLYRELR